MFTARGPRIIMIPATRHDALRQMCIRDRDMDNSVRITWLVVTALMPVLGVPLFWYTKSDVGHNALKLSLINI